MNQNLEIITYLEKANQTVCPLISLEVACNMLTHEEIRFLPQKYQRLSCTRILKFVGDDPNTWVNYSLERDDSGSEIELYLMIYLLIDHGWSLARIAKELRNQGFHPKTEGVYHGV